MTSCRDKSDGNYQSCEGCDVYITCVHGQMIAGRPCATGTFYDDAVRGCVRTSTTCALNTGDSCMASCDDVNDGDYQSCAGCNVFVSCLKGVMVKRTCETGTKWDDDKKSCVAASSTCELSTEIGQPSEEPEPTTTTTTTTPAPASSVPSDIQPHSCVGESCDGLPAGNYQSCYTCRGYVTCAPGHFPMLRPCPATLIWDDVKKICDYTSTTCDPLDFTTTTDNPVTSSGDDVELVHL